MTAIEMSDISMDVDETTRLSTRRSVRGSKRNTAGGSQSLVEDEASTSEDNRSSIPGAVFNFLNSIIGAGIIGIPFALQECGFYSGMIMIFAVGALTVYGVTIQINAGRKSGQYHYEKLVEHYFGKFGFLFTAGALFIFALMACIAYLIIIGNTLTPVYCRFFGGDLKNDDCVENWFIRRCILAGFSFLFILPLCLIKNMAGLSYSSALSIVSVVVIIVVIVYRAPIVSAQPDDDGNTIPYPDRFNRDVEFFNPRKFFAGLGALSFAFVCQHSAFLVFNSLKNNTPKRYAVVTNFSVWGAVIACTILGVAGYVAFGSDTKNDILLNFDATDDTVNVARMLLALTMVFTYPMEQIVARTAFYQCFWGNEEASNLRHYLVTSCIFGFTLFISFFIKDLGLVLELAGGLCGSLLGYIVPTMCHIQSEGGVKVLYSNMFKPAKLSTKLNNIKNFVLPVFLVIFGFVAMAAGTVSPFLMKETHGEPQLPHPLT